MTKDDYSDDGMLEDYDNALEEQIDQANNERILRRIENANSSELCGLLNMDDGKLVIDDSAEIYFMFERGDLPFDLKSKLTSHLGSCPNCKEQYAQYKQKIAEAERLLGDCGKRERGEK